MMHLLGAPLLARLLALPANIRLDWKGLPGTKALAYYKTLSISAVKLIITILPGVNLIKLFSFIADDEA